jgi:hypothetical protein
MKILLVIATTLFLFSCTKVIFVNEILRQGEINGISFEKYSDKEFLFTTEENYKGEFCPYSKESQPCQELCIRCEIYRLWQEHWKEIEKQMDYKAGR